MTPRSVTRTSAFRASSSSWRTCDTRTHSWASPVAPSLIPSGLSRTTSRPSSTDRPARWTSVAKARSAVVLRIPCEPMNATLAWPGHAGPPAAVTRGGEGEEPGGLGAPGGADDPALGVAGPRGPRSWLRRARHADSVAADLRRHARAVGHIGFLRGFTWFEARATKS